MTSQPSLETQAANGDQAAFTALMTATKADLHRFVGRYVGAADDAQDLLQETYAAAWFAMKRYDPARPFDVWLRAIALNKCRDWSRRRAVRRVVRGIMGLDAPEALTVDDDTPLMESTLDDRRRAQALQHALAELPDALKAPLLLAALKGRSHAQVADLLGITPKAVETRIARARKKLAEKLPSST